jgi:hypothetical protein
MKRSRRPARTPSKLSDSLHHQLNAYALAASAAGVAALALAQPAGAKVIYTKTHFAMPTNTSYELDLNHDGTIDFILSNRFGETTRGIGGSYLDVKPANSENQVWDARAYGFDRGYAAPLKPGRRIGRAGYFESRRTWAMATRAGSQSQSIPSGPWCGVSITPMLP